VAMDPVVEEPAEAAPMLEGTSAELQALMEKVLNGEMDINGTSEEQERFWSLVREGNLLSNLLNQLEKAVEDDPSSADARLQLADAYIAKLYTVPGGPEQGIWGGRAEEQWKSVVKLDPNNWDAQFSLAESYSYYPPFMGKTGEAVAGLEAAFEIQSHLNPEPKHVTTYMLLAGMYERQNEIERARETLETGLEMHPGDPKLLDALNNLGN
jgi:tetratricopeptide (TPR) repeat protein